VIRKTFRRCVPGGVDGRVKPGHDDVWMAGSRPAMTTGGGLSTIDFGRSTMDGGRSTMDGGRWQAVTTISD
jgi:hypothetical protein